MKLDDTPAASLSANPAERLVDAIALPIGVRVVTAMAAMRLVQDRRLDLDADAIEAVRDRIVDRHAELPFTVGGEPEHVLHLVPSFARKGD